MKLSGIRRLQNKNVLISTLKVNLCYHEEKVLGTTELLGSLIRFSQILGNSLKKYFAANLKKVSGLGVEVRWPPTELG